MTNHEVSLRRLKHRKWLDAQDAADSGDQGAYEEAMKHYHHLEKALGSRGSLTKKLFEGGIR